MTYETDFDDMYGSKYFGVTDLHGKEPRRRIGKVDVVELKDKDGKPKKKVLVFFDGEEKTLPINKTNALKLAAAYGKKYEKWIGATVELYSEMTPLNKEGVRIRILPTANDLNDEIKV
jgi:hypothetical protein